MSTKRTDGLPNEGADVARLRGRIDQLEDELAALQAWANAVVADAQKQVYWLDRLHLDLDSIMRHVPVDLAWDVYGKVRGPYQSARRLAGSLLRFVRRLSQ
jgi:hypothetical protein